MQKLKQDVILINRLGLHARAAVQLVKISQQHQEAIIQLTRPPRSANANSVLEILMLEAQKGDTVTVLCSGQEADKALQKICQLIQNGFNE
jgi:phosphocarrier protein NPr